MSIENWMGVALGVLTLSMLLIYAVRFVLGRLVLTYLIDCLILCVFLLAFAVDMALRPSEGSKIAFIVSYVSLGIFFGWRIFIMKLLDHHTLKRALAKTNDAKPGQKQQPNKALQSDHASRGR